MAVVSVGHCLEKFEGSVEQALKIGLCASNLYESTDGDFEWAGLWLRNPLAEQGILRLRRAWEKFLDRTYLRYLCGASCDSGYSPILTAPEQRTIHDARSFLLTQTSRSFLTWNRYATESRAEDHFSQGAPYKQAVNSVWQQLEEIGTLRNRFAHKSENTRQKFHNLVRRHYGHLPSGITPGRFLLDPSHRSSQDTRLEYYAASLKGAARSIVR